MLKIFSCLQTVSEEKEKAAAELEERERLAKQLEAEKKNLEEATTNLKGNLMVRRGGEGRGTCNG